MVMGVISIGVGFGVVWVTGSLAQKDKKTSRLARIYCTAQSERKDPEAPREGIIEPPGPDGEDPQNLADWARETQCSRNARHLAIMSPVSVTADRHLSRFDNEVMAVLLRNRLSGRRR